MKNMEKQLTQIRIPDDFIEDASEEIMSNFDHEINESTARFIKGNGLWSRYAGWNFNGRVWWQGGKWHCEVWCYGSYQKTISESTLEELMSSVCDEYGND